MTSNVHCFSLMAPLDEASYPNLEIHIDDSNITLSRTNSRKIFHWSFVIDDTKLWQVDISMLVPRRNNTKTDTDTPNVGDIGAPFTHAINSFIRSANLYYCFGQYNFSFTLFRHSRGPRFEPVP